MTVATTKRHRREFRKAKTALRQARRSEDNLVRVQAGEAFERRMHELGYSFDPWKKAWRRAHEVG